MNLPSSNERHSLSLFLGVVIISSRRINCVNMNIMTPIMVTKLTISSEDDARQSSVKTEHNVGWQTYLSSRRDIIVASVQTRETRLEDLYTTVRSATNIFIKENK